MKTPMQELQEKITELINDSKGDGKRTGDYRIGLHQALGLIDLEAEKEQIMEAYEAGHLDGYELGKYNEDEIYPDSSYYQQTYNQEQ